MLQLVDAYALFWVSDIQLGEKVAFQLCLAAPKHINIAKLPIASLTFVFAHGTGSVCLRFSDLTDAAEHSLSDGVQLVDLGHIMQPEEKDHVVDAPASWRERQTLILCGTIESEKAQELKVLSFRLSAYVSFSC